MASGPPLEILAPRVPSHRPRSRQRLREDFHWEERRLRRRLKLLVRIGEMVTPQTPLHVITNDPDDNRILECAVEGQAHLVVSGDRDLRRLKAYQGIPIVTPTDFLRTLGG